MVDEPITVKTAQQTATLINHRVLHAAEDMQTWVIGKMTPSMTSSCGFVKPYQSQKNAEELDNVSVGHWIQSSHQRVENGNKSRNHHRHIDVDVNDHTQSGPCDANKVWLIKTLLQYL